MPRVRSDNDSSPDPVDIHVGSKVKVRRLMLGLSQDDLAKLIGLTFQQIQKYEKGTNRISVSRLMDISRALRVSFDYFLQGCAVGTSGRKLDARGVSDVKQAALEPDPMAQRDIIELVRAYSSIRTPRLKKQLLEMAKVMASGNDNNTGKNTGKKN